MIELQNRLDRMSTHIRLYIFGQLCNHLIESRQYQRLEQVLTNLVFIEAKCHAGMINDILADYDRIRIIFDDKWNDESKLASFSQFLSHSSHLLRLAPEAFYQEAFNSNQADVHTSAIDIQQEREIPSQPWLRKISSVIGQHHSGEVISMAFWGDDRYLVVSTTELEVWIWDIDRRQLWRRCETPPSPAKSLAVSPNGEFLAAGYGSDVPTPLISGVRIWLKNGSTYHSLETTDWVYTVRWRNDNDIIIGAGLPHGSEAIGTLWKVSLRARTLEEIGNWLADRPMVLTWEPVPDKTDELMALSMDGIVYHLTSDYSPITAQEATELSLQLMSDQDYDAHDARLARRRPIAYRLCAPCVGTMGYYGAAQAVSLNQLFVLGEPAVPPELLAWHVSSPDGIYFFDFRQETSSRIKFSEDALAAGFKAICLAAMPSEHSVVIGTSIGKALKFSFEQNRTAPEVIHDGRFPVTALCLSPSGKVMAVGDAGGQVMVYELQKKELLFQVEQRDRAIVAKVNDSVTFVLYPDKLHIETENTHESENIIFNESLFALDFARYEDLVLVLCRSKMEHASNNRYIHVIDLAERTIILTLPVSEALPTAHSGKQSDKAYGSYEHIDIYADISDVSILLGCPQGLYRYPFLIFEGGKEYLLPESALKRERNITMMRMGNDLPDISFGHFAIALNRCAVIGSYADNAAHPNISGELRFWDLLNGEYSELQFFSSFITCLDSTSDGATVVGTEHGEASSWHFDGRWHRRATVKHPVTIVSVTCSEREQLGCSVSRDGLLMIWPLDDGTPILRTFVDVEPLCVRFLQEGRQLCLIDSSGGVHLWKIEEFDQLPHSRHFQPVGRAGESLSAVIRMCLDAAAQLNKVDELIKTSHLDSARSLLRNLPQIPNVKDVQRFWTAKIDSIET